MPRGFTVGAYAAAGELPPADEPRWYELLGRLEGVGGIEAPYRRGEHPDRLAGLLPSGWHVVVTLLPLTFTIAKTDSRYGLASADAAAREAALEDARRARESILRLHDALGRSAVCAVQLHSAPSRREPGASDAASLASSLSSLAPLDWDGAALVVEHCDAAVPGGTWQKGYLSLADEIVAVRAAGGRDARLGLSVNWGRSAIEGRSARTPVEHVREIQDVGLLRGMMLSGAAATDGPFGDAWRDVHNPVAAVDGHSLLDDDAIARSLDAIDGLESLDFVGAKVKAAPGAVALEERLAGVEATVAALAGAADRRVQPIA